MPDWKGNVRWWRYEALSPEDKARFKTWMQKKYGALTWARMIVQPDIHVQEWQRALERKARYPQPEWWAREPTPEEKKLEEKEKKLTLEQDTYLSRLNDYLLSSVEKGEITNQQANDIQANEAKLIEQGKPLTELPNYLGTKYYQTWRATYVPEKPELGYTAGGTPYYLPTDTSAFAPREKIAKWAKYNFIKTPAMFEGMSKDEALAEGLALEEYKRSKWVQDWANQQHQAYYEKMKEPVAQYSPQFGWNLPSADQLMMAATQAKSKAWTEERPERLAQLSSTYDWINRYIEEHKVNPYAWGAEAATIAEQRSHLMTAYNKGEMQKVAERMAAQKAPPAPAWLTQFAPGQVPGKTITKEEIPTPSGQLWAKTPASVREGLAGYIDYSGGRSLADILEQMAVMFPATPAGAGRASWRPARQGAGR